MKKMSRVELEQENDKLRRDLFLVKRQLDVAESAVPQKKPRSGSNLFVAAK